MSSSSQWTRSGPGDRHGLIRNLRPIGRAECRIGPSQNTRRHQRSAGDGLLFSASSPHRRLRAVAGRGAARWGTLIAIVRCPYCDTEDTRVIDSRPAEEGRAIRRRRQCAVCGQRFTTFERASVVVTVVKRDQSSQPYDSEKVRRGLESALADRPGAEEAVESVVAEIDAWARSGSAVVSSEEIGRQILDALRDLDEVAYLRFASVYKGFQGASDFEREVAALDRES